MYIDAKTKTLKEIITKQDELISEIDQQHLLKERELKKKIEQEQVLVDRYKEYVREQEKIVQKERQKLQRKKVLRQNCEEEQKMREDLEKIKREQEMMQIIMENYQKEIQRRQTAFEKQNHDENTSNCDQSLIYNNGNCVDEKLNLKLIDKDSDDYMIMSSKTNTKHTLFGLSNKKALRSKNVMKSNEKQQAVNYTTQKQVMDGALLLGDDSYSQNQCVGSNPNDVSNFSKNSTKSKSRRRSSSIIQNLLQLHKCLEREDFIHLLKQIIIKQNQIKKEGKQQRWERNNQIIVEHKQLNTGIRFTCQNKQEEIQQQKSQDISFKANTQQVNLQQIYILKYKNLFQALIE